MTNKIGKSLYSGDSVAGNIKKQVKSIPQALGFDLFEQLVKPMPGNVAEQLFGKKTESRPNFGSPRSDETIVFSAKEEEEKQRLIQKESANQRQIELLLAQLSEEKRTYAIQVTQLKETIEVVSVSAGIDTNIALEQPVQNSGVYHLRFFERILSFVRAKAEEASDWSQGLATRTNGKRLKGLEVFWQKGSSKQQVTESGTMMLQG